MSVAADATWTLLRVRYGNHPFRVGQVMGLVYLLDWRAAFTRQKSLTGASWKCMGLSMWSETIWDIITTDVRIHRAPGEDCHSWSTVFRTLGSDSPFPPASLDFVDLSIVDHVVHNTLELGKKGLYQLVRSTYPVLCSKRTGPIDLCELAEKYQSTGEVDNAFVQQDGCGN